MQEEMGGRRRWKNGGDREDGGREEGEESLSGGVTPCRHLRPSSGREHTIIV